ncbi:hypothetical protein THOM_3162 [Trachipleistophora hominis]|uniref:Uncharacterized protein n=1 Tax=Trachipleistophora hominis TaxID=72359 RepID=L7JT40_TRAHO|nr:hypothetical protein THOM_3162 [Trachipleistophora hominis]
MVRFRIDSMSITRCTAHFLYGAPFLVRNVVGHHGKEERIVTATEDECELKMVILRMITLSCLQLIRRKLNGRYYDF